MFASDLTVKSEANTSSSLPELSSLPTKLTLPFARGTQLFMTAMKTLSLTVQKAAAKEAHALGTSPGRRQGRR